MLSQINHQTKHRSMGLRRVATGFSFLLCLYASIPLAMGADQRPFPQAVTYVGKLKPSHVTQAQMNAGVASYYNNWKNRYVRQSSGATPGGGYYVEMQGTGGSGTEITTSEAHGYGMIVFALLSGQDSNARKYFDGMYNMYDKHRSKNNRNLMSWVIDRTESTSKDSSSATDGDMDIAYALLLAHHQWGSSGSIHYLNEAKRIINSGLKGDDVHSLSKRTKLGDWDDDQWNTRASDWMTGHMHAYYAATQDPFWNEAVSTVYDLIDRITKNYSPTTGLMPDFVVGQTPKPAAPNFLEADTDDDYSWNSCRYPLRIAMDAAHFQNAKAKAAMTKLINWAESATDGEPSGIMAGYRLNGSPLEGYSEMAFTAPFVAAATVATGDHQQFVNKGWDLMVKTSDSYYSDSINLLSLLFISGNWWAPVAGSDNGGTNPGDGGSGLYLGKPIAIPGTLEAEHYDIGRFSDTTPGNSGGQLRQDAVDIEASTTNGYNIGWTAAGEWLEFTVQVAETATYKMESLVASETTGGNFSVSIDGSAAAQVAVPVTGGWQTWRWLSGTVALTAGTHKLRVTMGPGEINFNAIKFTKQVTGDPGGETPSTKITVTDSGNDGHVAANLLDNSLDPESRWSALGKGQWVEFDLGSVKKVKAVDIAFFKGDTRRSLFSISVGREKGKLTQIYTGQSGGTSLGLERFDIPDTDGRYIRIIGNGNSLNDWNSFTEVKFVLDAASGGGSDPVDPVPPVSGVIKYNPYAKQFGNWYKGITHSHTKGHNGNPEGTTPDKMALVYKNAGYDFVAITDHDVYTKPASVTGILYIPGQEVSVSDGDMNVFGITRAVTPYKTGQQTIDEAISYGPALVQVNHPLDSDANDDGRLQQYLSGLNSLWGLEVYNGGRPSEDAVAVWDKLISQGKRVWATAGDDAHAVDETGRDWIVVNSSSNVQTEILANMKAGNFYATQGPDMNIRVNNNTVHVTTTKGREIKWYKSGMRLIKTTTLAGGEDTYIIKGDEGFVRVLVTNEVGKKAVSQPIFVKLPDTTGGSTPGNGGVTDADSAHAPITGTQYAVASASEFGGIATKIKPGDGVILKAGTWNNQKLTISVNGTAEKPIVIKAEQYGKTHFTGTSALLINGDYIEVHGLKFSGTGSSKPTVITFSPEAEHSRMANSVIEQYNPDGGEDHTWVFIDGQYNRVDHNVFTGKRGAGQTLRVWRNGKADHHRIDNNAFLERAPVGENGGETIQIGVSKYQTSASYTTIENNYFEACDGEAEIISVKSGKNTVRNNTLVRNAGAITLRHGHESKVHGNYILANGKVGAAGIRIYGYDHQIYNNYIDGVETRSSTFGGIAIHSGDIQSRTDTSTGTIPATNVSIMHNTLVNSRVAFVFGSGKAYQPSGIKIANNLIARQLDSVIYNVDGIKNLSAMANIYESSLGTIVSGFSKQAADLKAVQRNGYTLWKPSDTSGVINAGDNSLTVSNDIEGVSRDATPDVGAHEFGNGPSGPLRKQETGAQWYW